MDGLRQGGKVCDNMICMCLHVIIYIIGIIFMIVIDSYTISKYEKMKID